MWLLAAAARANELQYPLPPFVYYLRREVAVHNCTTDSLPYFARRPRRGQFCLGRSPGIPNCTEKPCPDRGRAFVRQQPPQGSLWIFWILTAMLFPCGGVSPHAFITPHTEPRDYPYNHPYSPPHRFTRFAFISADERPPYVSVAAPLRES